jgi:hypothetical protein
LLLLSDNFYFCKHCKKVLHELEDLLFVEEGSPNCFCSEACIEKFYSPLVDYFTGKIDKLQKDLKLQADPALELLESSSAIEKALSRPDEIWRIENQLKEEVYTYISKQKFEGKDAYLLIICFVFNKSPSFVLAMTATSNEFMMQKFQVGEQIESIDEFYKQQVMMESNIDSDTIEHVEFKKSAILAEHMTLRKETDISFENFGIYDDFIASTLQDADEVYSYTDNDGDDLKVFIKAHEKDGISFFYVVICYPYSMDEVNETVIPVISFPTIDGDLCSEYRRGSQVFGNLKN